MIKSSFKSRVGSNGACTVCVPEGWKNYARHGKAKGWKFFREIIKSVGLQNNSVWNSKTVLWDECNASWGSKKWIRGQQNHVWWLAYSAIAVLCLLCLFCTLCRFFHQTKVGGCFRADRFDPTDHPTLRQYCTVLCGLAVVCGIKQTMRNFR